MLREPERAQGPKKRPLREPERVQGPKERPLREPERAQVQKSVHSGSRKDHRPKKSVRPGSRVDGFVQHFGYLVTHVFGQCCPLDIFHDEKVSEVGSTGNTVE
jgi:hypothetical protein